MKFGIQMNHHPVCHTQHNKVLCSDKKQQGKLENHDANVTQQVRINISISQSPWPNLSLGQGLLKI